MTAVALFGGRNDKSTQAPILDDFWLLKLHNLEWLKVQIGGEVAPIPRCFCATFVNGKEIVVLGGQTEGFKPCKSLEILQLDQARIDMENPILKRLAAQIKSDFKAARMNAFFSRKDEEALNM